MTRPHQLGLKVKGHPLLWLVVLAGTAFTSFWLAVQGAMDAARVGGSLGAGSAAQLFTWAIVNAVAGLVLTYHAGRVARLCWKMYAPHPPPRTGTCRRCSYDLTGNVSGRCPECGITNRAEVTNRPAA